MTKEPKRQCHKSMFRDWHAHQCKNQAKPGSDFCGVHGGNSKPEGKKLFGTDFTYGGEVEVVEAEIVRETKKTYYLATLHHAFNYSKQVPKEEACLTWEEAVLNLLSKEKARKEPLEQKLERINGRIAKIKLYLATKAKEKKCP